ncbi:hypothetical protein MOMA_08961 [Moraxella macacae 0408225]|uniref:DUF1275 domain-containing protein n=1 Tax=Moraxella macacae 0408225 TaxID=1230338 RepID=L2F7E0_9GAMM|nr:YoaK family protein [Moraxella macacae]ELA08676.1 hypothetical protein MOMA_08961 [Moraxella macacae 0408225]
MLEKLPLWIRIGGGVLAFSAGCVNSTALVGFTHLAASHVTGNVSLFATAIANSDYKMLFMVCAVLLSFLAGSVISGFVVGNTDLKEGRRYGLTLCIETVLLIVSLILFYRHSFLGHFFATMACGLQNSMVATYKGTGIRTTHLTGLTSDMGASIGNWLAKRKTDKKMVMFQAMIWYCFCGGGVIGAILYVKIGYLALILPIIIVMLSAILYHWVFLHWDNHGKSVTD